jgi:hypothetical protein
LTPEEIKIRVDDMLIRCAVAQEEMPAEEGLIVLRRRPNIKSQAEQSSTGNPLKPLRPEGLVMISLQLEDGPHIERKVKS